uniref:Uncharacterized protein n=1 Tax=Daphnia magna TaxID=35525 RepID=A0A0P6I281_9CRUS
MRREFVFFFFRGGVINRTACKRKRFGPIDERLSFSLPSRVFRRISCSKLSDVECLEAFEI